MPSITSGGLYQAQGYYQKALENYEQALAIFQKKGQRPHEGGTLNNIGSVYLAQGRYREALAKFEAALVIHRQVGNV